jgi:hypothetical protein
MALLLPVQQGKAPAGRLVYSSRMHTYRPVYSMSILSVKKSTGAVAFSRSGSSRPLKYAAFNYCHDWAWLGQAT